MNKKLIKMIASIACGLGVATSIPFAVASCGSSSKEELLISYEDGKNKDFGNVDYEEDWPHHTVSSDGQIIANFSFTDATWCFDVTCVDKEEFTPEWAKFLSISVNNDDQKIWITAKYTNIYQGGAPLRFSFNLYAKIDEKQTNTISGFTLWWTC